MWHPYADLLRQYRMIACYHRTELEPINGITWLANDAFGDWRHEMTAVGPMGMLVNLEDDILVELGGAANSTAVNHLNKYRSFTYETDRSVSQGGPAVHRRGLGDWGAPTVFWNNGSTCSVVSPTISQLQADPNTPLWAYTNPLRLEDAPSNNKLSVSLWYKLTDTGLVLDEDGDGSIDASSFNGRMFELKNFTSTNGNPTAPADRWYLYLDLDYARDASSNNACVTIEATLTNKPESLGSGSATAIAETDLRGATLTNNDWHHVVVTVDAGKLLIYCDSKFSDVTSATGADIPTNWHPRCRINRSFDGGSFDGISKIAYGPVAVYNCVLSQWDVYRLWASMRRPLDMAVEGLMYRVPGADGPQQNPPSPDPGWSIRGPNPGGWEVDGLLGDTHTFTGRRAEYRGDNRWIEMRQSYRWYANYSWHVTKFRGRDDFEQKIYNADGAAVAAWDGCIQNPHRTFATTNPAAVNNNFFFDYQKYHIGFHLDQSNETNRGMFMVLGLQHHAHWEPGLGSPAADDHRQGPVTWFDNWADAGGLNYPLALNLCNGTTFSDGGGTQVHRGIKFTYDPDDGWGMNYTGHGGTIATADLDVTIASNIKMVPNLYNTVVMGSGKTCRVIRQGYNTRSGVMKPSLHENDDVFNNGNQTLPVDSPTSRQEEFHQYLETSTLRNTPGLPVEYGAADEPTTYDVGQDGDLVADRKAYDFDRVGPIAWMMSEVPQGTHERVVRLLQGQHTMRSRPGLRSPLRHVHLTAPTRVTK